MLLRRGIISSGLSGEAFDPFPSTTEMLWCRDRALDAYDPGNLVDVRRSSDNLPLDIGNDGAPDFKFNSAAFNTHIGGGSGFAATAYDQHGNTDFAQATAGAQPDMLSAGTMVFDGTNSISVFNMALAHTDTFSIGYVSSAEPSSNNYALTLIDSAAKPINFQFRADLGQIRFSGSGQTGTYIATLPVGIDDGSLFYTEHYFSSTGVNTYINGVSLAVVLDVTSNLIDLDDYRIGTGIPYEGGRTFDAIGNWSESNSSDNYDWINDRGLLT